jgi:hypothetical protein
MSDPRPTTALSAPAADDAVESAARPSASDLTPSTPRVSRAAAPAGLPTTSPDPSAAAAVRSASAAAAREPSRTRPTLRIFGALLWAYVVLGEWVVGMRFPEPLALLLVIAVFGLTWAGAVRHDARPLHLGQLEPGLYALALWAAVLLAGAAVPGNSSPARVETVSAALWCVAAFSSFVGRRPRPLGARTLRARAVHMAVGIVVALGTALSALSALRRI